MRADQQTTELTPKENNMRLLTLSSIALSISGCALIPPTEVPLASATQRQAVVLDIDGTLTPKDLDVFEPRLSAADALGALSKKGYKIVYVTTRIPLYQSTLPAWLQQNGFPAGSLHVAQTSEERANPSDYKTRILALYRQAGWSLDYAYGDSSTDFTAYAKAGVPREHVFALKRRDAKDCQVGVYQACLNGWTEHLPYIEREIPSAQ
jgi:phosphatidate phosphatase PAH1